jgi:predicted acetyltransferase
MSNILRTDRISLISLDVSNLEHVLNDKIYQFRDIDERLSNPDYILKDNKYLVNLRLNQLKSNRRLADWLLYLVVDNQKHTIVGNVGFHDKPDKDGMIEFGITIGKSFRKQGYAFEAISTLCSWAIKTGEVRSIRASVSPDNVASKALISKLGLIKIGKQIDDIDGLEYVFQIPIDVFPTIAFVAN